MLKVMKNLIILLIVLYISTMPAFAAGKELINEISSMVNELIEDGKVKGAVLSVTKSDKIIFCNGFGFADEYNNIAADGETTAFRIGSVSKTFVAAAAQILNQEGKLDMNTDISAYLKPDFPKLTYPVTMHQLLTHTAGFEELVTGIAVANVSDTEPLSESVRKYMPAQVYKPGEISSYSNYGIALAAYVIESITDVDFSKFCMERIFMPLNMNDTTYEYMHDVAYVSKAYLPNGNEGIEPYINLYPEGSAVSTAQDMAKYMMWLLNNQDNRVLSGEYKKELFIKQFSMSEKLEGGGYVWNRKERNNKIYYDKKGETLHFYTRIALYPETDTGVFLSFNTYVPENEINAVMKKATDLLYGKYEDKKTNNIKNEFDIRGIYVNNWSSFKTQERILSYIIPGKIIKISESKGVFLLNGEKMKLIGDNTYSSLIGTIQFIEKNDKLFIATESAVTYSQLPFWQNKTIQLFIPLLFVLLSVIYFINGMRLKKAFNIYSPLTQLLALVALFIFLYRGIINYSILKYSALIMVFGWLIVILGVAGIMNTLLKKKNDKIDIIDYGWNFANLMFAIWLFTFNII
ncbi:serine hydrolase domain-containing protein [Sedimentibacter sp.]|uniref:serine hydrolase domain-containing protein n=2 Tax=Sedimentibacter sp. TaxID=1960295 RepID=UPI0028B0E68B|nr:serine hydrolase domain-containing protein [Sedimentibacter sp.]